MNSFFENPKEQSIIKSRIVSQYFDVWSKIINNWTNDRMGYIDLFSGPGYYEDGTPSTPIIVLQKCINNENLKNKMVIRFNDADENNVKSLRHAIDSLENVSELKYPPKVTHKVITEEFSNIFSNMSIIPTFSFIDPFGYKGLTYDLIQSLVKDWGCDCIFFFNYNRINSGITNPKIENHINNIFTSEIAEQLRNKVKLMKPEERELLIMDTVCNVFSNERNNYVLPFRFVSANRNTTSHYLIFVSKNRTAYEIMKDIMSKLSSEKSDGIGSFSYIPNKNLQLEFIFNSEYSLIKLKERLLKKYKNKHGKLKSLFHIDNIGTPYVLKNYKDALRELEEEGKIQIIPPKEKRRKYKGQVSMADTIEIYF